MNFAHLHLILNHLPVIGLLIGTLAFIFALMVKSRELQKFSLFSFVCVGICAIAAFFTGEPAEEIVEKIAGVSHQFIEAHESAAMFALISSVILGIISFIILWIYRGGKELSYAAVIIVMLLAFSSNGLMAWTANLGGKIRHTELINSAITNNQSHPATNSGGREVEDSD